MKTIFNVSAVAVFLVVTASPCFALWMMAPVSRERAKEMGMEVRANTAGPDEIRVELEFKLRGELKNFSRVDLQISAGKKSLLAAPLREDRSKPGRVLVSFTADRTRLDQIDLRVMVPGTLGGTIYDLRVKEFVELEEDR
jgi:hypothetical protein